VWGIPRSWDSPVLLLGTQRLLTRSEFESALKGALRHYTQTDLLTGNALLHARVLSRSGPDGNTPQKLRALLGETADSLFANERDRKLYRVLDLTYFNPAPKQEAAAARLGLSLSTYRRYLTTGIDRLTEWLWRQEQESAQSETTADHSTERTFADAAVHQDDDVAKPRDVFQLGVAPLTELSTAPPLPDKPSIAVLPFTNMSGDSDQDYFADGMAEEIITALSRIRWLFVIARNSSFTYKGQAIDVKRVGRELGVRYVLGGSVRRAGSRVRITAQLIEAETGAHLWADRFDGSLEDVFDLQDKVSASAASIIGPTVRAEEIRRAIARPTDDLTAYDLYLRAVPNALSAEKNKILDAIGLLGQAIERDPRYAAALSLAALCHQFLCMNGWNQDEQASRDQSIDFARRSLRVGGEDGEVLATSGFVLGYFGEDIDAAVSLIDRSLELNPSYARGWIRSGWVRLWAGRPDLAVEHFQTAMRLNPRELTSHNLLAVGVAYFFTRHFEQAKAMLLRSLQEEPNWAPTHRFLAACCAQMGQLDEAREVVGRLRAITPAVMPRVIPFRNPEHRDLFLSCLRLASGETT
jgi:TolB-like protein/Flp pilus assembly protein TadD